MNQEDTFPKDVKAHMLSFLNHGDASNVAKTNKLQAVMVGDAMIEQFKKHAVDYAELFDDSFLIRAHHRKNLQHLKCVKGVQDTTQCMMLAIQCKTLTELTFSRDFDEVIDTLQAHAFPPGLRHLTFGCYFNNRGATLQKRVFPPGLTQLTFGHNFNTSVQEDVLPPSLTHLTFGFRFNTPLEKGVLPRGLGHLTFGFAFNNGDTPLQKDVFPPGLKHLTLGVRFNNRNTPLQKDVLPPSLTQLTFGSGLKYGNSHIQNDVVLHLQNLTHLTHLTHHGHITLEEGSTLPDSLRYLYLHQCSDLELSMLPDGLTELTILNLTFQSDPIELINVLPPTLRHLKIGTALTSETENRWYLLRPDLEVTYL